jgi:hypothetical protein
VRRAEDEPDGSQRSRRHRGDVSIADVVAAAARLGATGPADLAVIAHALRLTIPAAAIEPPPEPTPMPSPPPVASAEPAARAATAPDRAGITGAPVAARLRHEDHAELAPAWLDAVEALPPAVSGSFWVRSQPPLPAMQARSSMAALAATWRPGRRLDMATLVRRSAHLQPLTACFLAELRTASFVHILVDRGEGMEPFTDDVDFLIAQIMDVAGRDRVEQRTFAGTPRRGVDPNFFTGETAKWERPAAGSMVLILTDLGVGGPAGSRDRAPAAEWRAVAATVASAEAELRVITPFAPSRWPAGLAAIMRIVSWDSLVHLVELRG